jgi:carboxyl-terminal processing protease
MFIEKFEPSDDIINQLITYAETQDLTLNDADFSRSKDHISHVIKAYIARDLWNTNEFYQVYNARNESYLKALEIIKDTGKYTAALDFKN